MEDISTTVWQHSDHLGSARATSLADGSRRDRFDYSPFGANLPEDDAAGRDRAFASHERGADDSVDYSLARYLAAQQGRFLSTDTRPDITHDAPISWNRYLYVRANPLRLVDPDGFASQEAILARYQNITSSPALRTVVQQAWKATDYSLPATAQREHGASLFKSSTGALRHSALADGTARHVYLPTSDSDGSTLVATVHSHTSEHHVEEAGTTVRVGGPQPSPDDRAATAALGVPGFIVTKTELNVLTPEGDYVTVVRWKRKEPKDVMPQVLPVREENKAE